MSEQLMAAAAGKAEARQRKAAVVATRTRIMDAPELFNLW
jgi:hypothetical protein